MPKLTILELTQDILSEMDSDNVNSINDTEEAYQVARIIKNAYYEIIEPKYHKHFDTLGLLESSGDSGTPTHMKLPNDLIELHWINYNDNPISYKTPDVFLSDNRNLTNDTLTVTDPSGIQFKVLTSIDPTYWTSFDEENIVFNAYDSTEDTILQSSKSQIFYYREPSLSLVDEATPDLPLQMFSQLLEEAKSTAFAHIKQMPSAKAEQKVNRQRKRLSTQGRVNNGIKYNNYGR